MILFIKCKARKNGTLFFTPMITIFEKLIIHPLSIVFLSHGAKNRYCLQLNGKHFNYTSTSSYILRYVFSESLSQGMFPEKLKIAQLTHTFKSDDETSVTNYITVLQCFSKF